MLVFARQQWRFSPSLGKGFLPKRPWHNTRDRVIVRMMPEEILFETREEKSPEPLLTFLIIAEPGKPFSHSDHMSFLERAFQQRELPLLEVTQKKDFPPFGVYWGSFFLPLGV